MRRRKHRGRGLAFAAVLVLAGLVGVAGIAYALSHRPHAGPPPAATASRPPAAQATPARVVREYFTAINRHRYLLAYRLRDETGESFADFRAGFAGTAQDIVTIDSVSGDVVTAQLRALQTDGTVKTFQGTYTVANGVISSTDVHQVS